MPKATILATLGGLPYSEHIIPGSQGLTNGLFIQKCSVFAILFFVVVGVTSTKFIGRPIAIYLTSIDNAVALTKPLHDSPSTDPMTEDDDDLAVAKIYHSKDEQFSNSDDLKPDDIELTGIQPTQVVDTTV